jgi:hypothetical protein
MASLRKKYVQVETPTANNDAPIASTPVQAAAEPPPVAEDKPLEKPAESNPVDEAAKSALKQRLQEMERAEALVHQQQPQQGEHRLAAEPRSSSRPCPRMCRNGLKSIRNSSMTQ